jgi:hypothetical protein
MGYRALQTIHHRFEAKQGSCHASEDLFGRTIKTLDPNIDETNNSIERLEHG